MEFKDSKNFILSLKEIERRLEEQKRIIDESQRIIDESQRIINESQRIINENQRIINESLRIIDEDQRIIDENQRIIDEQGRRIDDINRGLKIENRINKTNIKIENLEEIMIKEKSIININNDEKCMICLFNYSINDKISYLPCAHFFHSCCIKNWIIIKNKCPLCRINI